MAEAGQSRRRTPQEVYWRRRFLLLAAVFLVIWLSIKVFDDGDAQPEENTPVAAEPTATPTADGPINGKIAVQLNSSQDPCDPEKLRVIPSVPDGQFVGGPVPVRLVISTSQDSPCTFDAQIADLLVVISANDAPVWDNAVCNDALLPEPVAVTPGWSTVANATWSGRGSGKKCSPKQDFGSPGRYVIQSATIGGEPGKDTFTLVSPPKAADEP